MFVKFPCPGPIVPNLWLIEKPLRAGTFLFHESLGQIHHNSDMCVQTRVLMKCHSNDS